MYEQRTVASSFVHCIWRAVVNHDAVYSDPANEYWSIGFIKHVDGTVSADVFGPSLTPRVVEGYEGEVYWGIEFHTHVTIKDVNKGDILGSDTPLPVRADVLHLAGRAYQVPMYDELIAFADRLKKDGVLVSDLRVLRALNGDERGLSERSRQRHFRTTTGLNKKQIEQLQRARRAFYLLQCGNSLSGAAHGAGYADQPHMTRAFKLLRGETPARIIADYLQHDE